MPTIALFNTAAEPDAWHHVRAPGGYECWRIVADDSTSDVQLFVELWEGDNRNEQYRTRFERYIRNPTRTVPPSPAEYIAVRAEIFQAGKLLAKSLQEISSDYFAAQADRLNIRLQASSLSANAGACALVVSTPEISATLSIIPRASLEPLVVGDRHRWIFAQPVCEARGEIKIIGTNQTLSFRGDCFKDHIFGDQPLPQSTIEVSAIASERALALRIVDRKVQAVEFNSIGARELDASNSAIGWPRSLKIGDKLQLDAPRQLGGSHAIYDGMLSGTRCRALARLCSSST